jgi:hypothetical protein
MPPPGQSKRLFTVREFERIAEAGIIRGRYELAHGEVVEMAPVGNAHSVAVEDLRDVRRAAWPHPRFVRTQATHRFDDGWAPMPETNSPLAVPGMRVKVSDVPPRRGRLI